MSLYLAEVSRWHPDEHLLLFLDRAGGHQAKALVVPDNLTLDWLPAYSPQCNPKELVWREVRRQPFSNHDYDSMDAVENALAHRLHRLETSPAQIQSLTGFDWIINVRSNANSISRTHVKSTGSISTVNDTSSGSASAAVSVARVRLSMVICCVRSMI